MIDQLPTRADNIALCLWCGTALGSANFFKSRVCVRCYKILTTANLSDDEIFAEKSASKRTATANKKVEEDDGAS